MKYGSIPNGLCVLHHCDNPPCVRPDHLFLGTAKDNSDDKIRKGRYRSRKSDLTVEKVREIRTRYAAGGITFKELGVIYNKHPNYLKNLVSRRYWKQVD
jgi:hypothetical protein